MLTSPTDLTAQLGSRICHDLINPLGAISNGVELLQLSGVDGPEIEMIAQAVENATLRVRYFRVAFGVASEGQRISAAEIAKVLAPGILGPKLALEWQATGDLARREVKLALLTLLCLETAMPFGGQVSVRCEGSAWVVSGEAERLKMHPELWGLIDGADTGALPAPAHLQFALLGPELAAQARVAKVEISETRIIVRF